MNPELLAFENLFIKQIVFQNAVYCPETVACANLFSLIVGAAIVRDAYFINTDVWNP